MNVSSLDSGMNIRVVWTGPTRPRYLPTQGRSYVGTRGPSQEGPESHGRSIPPPYPVGRQKRLGERIQCVLKTSLGGEKGTWEIQGTRYGNCPRRTSYTPTGSTYIR